MPEKHQSQRKHNNHKDAEQKGRKRQSDRGPHSVFDFIGNVATRVRCAEVSDHQPRTVLPKNRIGKLVRSFGLLIPKQRLVVAVLFFPVLNRFSGHAFAANIKARHVVRRVDRKEQHKGQQIDADQNQEAVADAS